MWKNIFVVAWLIILMVLAVLYIEDRSFSILKLPFPFNISFLAFYGLLTIIAVYVLFIPKKWR